VPYASNTHVVIAMISPLNISSARLSRPVTTEKAEKLASWGFTTGRRLETLRAEPGAPAQIRGLLYFPFMDRSFL